MTFTPTEEQLAIVAAGKHTNDNLLISARAGAAKTSTLILLAKAMPTTQMLYLAFNKKVADEMREKMPANCTAKTLNALGHAAWASAIGKKLTLKDNKCYSIMTELIADLSKAEQEEVYENMGTLLKACGHAKASGHVPDLFKDRWKNTRLFSDKDLIDSLEEIPSPLEEMLILRTLEKSMELAYQGVVDFADQLLLPTVFRASFPPFPLILADEVQDFSDLNHMMLAKLIRRRLIAVGDQAQAIYGFRGAHESGMAAMKQKFSMTELSLTTTFRCPPAVVEHVRWRTPDIRAWAGHPHQGKIVRHETWDLDDIPDEAAIICRNNAPLFSMAIRLLRAGRYPNLWGNDVGRGLINVMKKFGPPKMSREAALGQLVEWGEAQRKKVRNHSVLDDKIACIRVFLEAKPTLGEAMEYCEALLRSQGKVNLMTGHKSKGAEFEIVFFLDEKLVRDEGQDLNLRYVICTRARQELHYINSADYGADLE